MSLDRLCDGIVIGSDNEGSRLRRMPEGGDPLVVVGLVDGAAEGDASALKSADVVGGPDQDFALGRKLIEGARVGLLEGNSSTGVLDGLAQDEGSGMHQER